MKRTTTAGVIALSGLLLVGVVQAQNSYREEFDVRPGELLKIDAETGGSLEITGWDEDRLVVEAEFTGPDRDNVTFDTRRSSGKVTITTDFEDRGKHHSSGGTIRVRVPRSFDLDLETTGGNVTVDGVQGRVQGKTMGGNLTFRGLDGSLVMSTMGGNIELSDSRVDGKVETMGGNVELSDVEGNVEANTLGGNVMYDNVRPGAGSGSAGGEVKISTHGGNINVPDAPFGADVTTLGGNIRVKSAAEYVKAKTMGGNINVEEVDGWVKATTMGGSINVVMVGDPGQGRRDVRLSSKSGKITLTVPEGLSMEIDVTLAYTKNSRQDYEITSDFPMKTRRSDAWDHSAGSPRRYVTATGTIDGGAHKIKIETINGDVEIRRGR
jgi:DUF4097 and DUF4098 domain-containing protein YvlB